MKNSMERPMWSRALPALLLVVGLLMPRDEAAQKPHQAPPVAAGENADGLFVATIPAKGAKDDSGKPGAPSMDPVAFFVNGQIRSCDVLNPNPTDDPIPTPVLETLNRIYAPGHEYPISFDGALFGMTRTTGSMMEDDPLDHSGSFSWTAKPATHVAEKGLTGTIWTGVPLIYSHPAVSVTASADERNAFLEAASKAYSDHHVSARPNTIHSSTIVKRQLRAGHTALIGNTIVQLASDKPRTYYSYRLFLVAEETNGIYATVLVSYHRVTAYLDSDAPLPKPGELVDEEARVDRERFADNVPLFRGESDAIITERQYCEDWGYSLYRSFGGSYRLIYTGCGGGV
jgi:hypothetical protein